MGWYHSHPGYGCWLSGIDVGTQAIQQQYQEPFLAIVVDPHRTIAAGKVEIGAFRTYPEVHCSRQNGHDQPWHQIFHWKISITMLCSMVEVYSWPEFSACTEFEQEI